MKEKKLLGLDKGPSHIGVVVASDACSLARGSELWSHRREFSNEVAHLRVDA